MAQSTPVDYSAAIPIVERFIDHEMSDKEIPAVSIALIDDQRMVWSRGFGLADPESKTAASADTMYRVGSVSKLFTDIAVMRLVEQGKIDLDAPVSHYLPELHPHNPFGQPITIRELMSHRSGLVREPPVGSYFDPTEPSLAGSIASLNGTTLVYPPQSHLKYSNAGVATVGYVLQRVNGEPFAKAVQKMVLDPLGMRQSSFEPTPDIKAKLAKGFMWTTDGRVFAAPTFTLGIDPAGALYTTVTDLGRFWSALTAGMSGPNGPILGQATLDQMLVPQFARPGTTKGFGLGFAISDLDGRRVIGHGGAIYGFATTFFGLPAEKLGVAVVATKDASNAVTNRIGRVAIKAMLAIRDGKAVPQPDITSPVDPQLAHGIAGRYRNEKEGFDLSVDAKGQLMMLKTAGGQRVRLRSLGDLLMVDDPVTYGETLVVRDGTIAIGEKIFKRVPIEKPAAAPARWRGLIGEYGWDHDILYIHERDGKLWALIEWIEFDPLEEVSRNVFKFPTRGLYDGERLTFTRDENGRATQVVAGTVTFKRRNVGPEEGAKQLRITPVRPVSELVKEALAANPPQERGTFRPSDLVELTTLDPAIKLEIRYATTNNFLGSVLYSQARAFLQRPAAEALVRAGRKLRSQGYGLLVHDAYRPWYVTKVFWDATPDDKKIFVANPSQGSRHNRGAAVDLSLYDLKSGKPVEMVGTYDEMTDRAYPDYPGGTSLQRWHRRLLRDAMEWEGFHVYEAEWWHFDYKDWRQYPIGNVPFDQIAGRTAWKTSFVAP